MTSTRKAAGREGQKSPPVYRWPMRPDSTHSSDLPSSEGLSPTEVTPKDVTPDHAAWHDLQTRETCSVDSEVRKEALLDEAIELTFPASDPIAELPVDSNSKKAEQCEDEDEILLDEAILLTFPASDPIAVTPHDKLGILPKK
jgi:hypothetical protein